MQNAALAACGIDGRYARLHIRAGELPAVLRLLAPAGFIGANLTIPHKVAALTLLDSLDPHAAYLGAVNTVRVEPDGTLRGFNTDGPGFSQAVSAEFGLSLRGARVLILGAGGGAGRALAAQCASESCARLGLVNRTFEKARDLAAQLGERVETTAVPWNDASLAAALHDTDLVVNTTSLGLRSEDPSPLPRDCLSPSLRVFDTVYRSGNVDTPLVVEARAAGALAVGGFCLLLHQGALAFEHWFNQPAPLEIMRQALASA